jgi:hypothetical protein
LLSLCDTRWVNRNTPIETFLALYIPIVNTLDKFRYATLKDPKAEQLYHAITNFQHIMSTYISCFLIIRYRPMKSFTTNRNIGFCIS